MGQGEAHAFKGSPPAPAATPRPRTTTVGGRGDVVRASPVTWPVTWPVTTAPAARPPAAPAAAAGGGWAAATRKPLASAAAAAAGAGARDWMVRV